MSLEDALSAVGAGEMVLLQPGTYTIPVVSDSERNTIKLTKSGRDGAPIVMVAANCGRALFDFSYPADEWQSGNGLINAGTDVGLPYEGDAPDLGPFERR